MHATRRRMLALAASATIGVHTRRAEAAMFEPERSVVVTAEDIAWFRTARAGWVSGESGAPAIIPAGVGVDDYLGGMLGDPSEPAAPEPTARRLEPILCAAFLNAAFTPGTYHLDPPVRPDEIGEPTGDLAAWVTADRVKVRAEHIALLRNSSWRGSAMDDKRPYGTSSYYEMDIARILGQPLPVQRDADLPPAQEKHNQELHRELLASIQAYVQHAAFAPGTYLMPRGGWSPPFHPRCATLPFWQLARYRFHCAANAPIVPGRSDGRDLTKAVVRDFVAKDALFETGTTGH